MSRRRAETAAVPAFARPPHGDPTRGLLTLLAVALIALLLLPCLLSFSPDVYFDMDPRLSGGEADVITVLTPTAAMALYVALTVVSALVLGAHAAAGHRLSRVGLALGLLGLALASRHLGTSVEATLRTAGWCAAVSAALAMLHLAQHDRPRRIFIAALVALLIPQLIDSLLYVWFEHPATVQNYLENEARTLAARGWSEGSPQHLLFRRRLMFADATGPFGLSNVYGSIVAAMTLLALGLALAGAVRRQWVQAATPALAAAAGVVVLYLTHSKGAPLAALMALGLAPIVLWLRRRGGRLRWLAGAAAIALVLIAIAVIPLRGAMGPPDTHEGERSLLFRWHYWQGAAAIVADQPARLLRGVGPAGFKELYSQHKNPLNPEEVTSTHNVFIDLVVLLGAAGLAWSVMLIKWLWIAAVGASAPAPPPQPDCPPSDDEQPSLAIRDSDLRLAAALGAILFITQFAVQFPTQLTPEGFVGFCASAVLFVVLMALMLSPGWTWPRGGGALGLALAAAVLLIHGQIEMTFFHDGAVLVAFAMIGAAAGAVQHHARREPRDRREAVARWAPAFLLLMLALLLTVHASRLARQQAHLRQAADALRVHNVPSASAELALALRVMPRDAATLRNHVMLQLELVETSRRMGDANRARLTMNQVLTTLQQAQARGMTDTALLRLQARSEEVAAALLSDASHHGVALALWQQLLQRNPCSIQDTLAYADLLWRLQRQDEAKAAYRRALELDRQAYLDPAKQLDEQTRAMVLQRAQ